MESNRKDLQGEFFPRGPFTRPLACGHWQYVPILKSMPGELAAIDQAPGSVLDRMTPLIEVDERIMAGTPKGRSRAPRLADRLAPTMTADRPFFIDFPWIESDAQVLVGPSHRRTAVNAMELVLGECRNHGLQSIRSWHPSTIVDGLPSSRTQRRWISEESVFESHCSGSCLKAGPAPKWSVCARRSPRYPKRQMSCWISAISGRHRESRRSTWCGSLMPCQTSSNGEV